jgi:hypothetical protein
MFGATGLPLGVWYPRHVTPKISKNDEQANLAAAYKIYKAFHSWLR